MDTRTLEDWAEYERICAAEHEAEIAFWQTRDIADRLAAQVIAMMGLDAYMAAVEVADLVDGREDEEFWAKGQW